MLCSLILLAPPFAVAKSVLNAPYNPDVEKKVKISSGPTSSLGASYTTNASSYHSYQTDGQHSYLSEPVHKCTNYSSMNPKLRGFIDRNASNYETISRPFAATEAYSLYRDVDAGFEIRMTANKGAKLLYLLRLTFLDAEDMAWKFVQTPAINPKTGQQWIDLNADELQQIATDTGKDFSRKEKAYLNDVLAVVNQNFHFIYGEKFGTTDKIKDDNQLIGKWLPPRVLMFNSFNDFLPREPKQKRKISSFLGRPLYEVNKGVATNTGISYELGNKGLTGTAQHVHLKDKQVIDIPFLSLVSVKNMKIMALTLKFTILKDQLRSTLICATNFSQGLNKLMEHKKVDVCNEQANTTPLTRALYLVNLKTQNYLFAILSEPAIAQFEPTKDRYFRSVSEKVELPSDLIPIRDLPPSFRKSRVSLLSSDD